MDDSESGEVDDSGAAVQNPDIVKAAERNFHKWNATAVLGGCFSMKSCEDGLLRIECNTCHVRTRAFELFSFIIAKSSRQFVRVI
jgi:hypothetical protein